MNGLIFSLLTLFLWSSTSYGQPQPQVGYATITAGPGSGAATGFSLYSLWNARDVLIAESGFGAATPTTLARAFVAQEGTTRTGIAILNPSPASETVQLTLRDFSGKQVGQRTDTYAPGQHQSLFVDQLFSVSGNFIGSLTVQASGAGVVVATARMSTNYAGEPVITTTAVADLNAPPSNATIVPQIAAGNGISTQVVFMNPSDQPAVGTIQLFADDGSALQLIHDGTAGSSYSYNIPGQGTLRSSLTLPGAVRAGFARAVPAAGSAATPGLAIFQTSRNGGLVSEAGVLTASPTPTARIFVDQANTRTGVALANVNANSVSVTFTLLDVNGNFLQQSSQTVSGNGHAAFFTDQIFPVSSGFTGLMQIDSSSPVAVVALRMTTNARQDPLYSTLPVVDLTRTQPQSSLMFPQVAFGYFGSQFSTTRSILINEDMNFSASGSLQYFQPDGTVMNQPLGCPATTFSYQIPPGGATDAERPCWPLFLYVTKSPSDHPVISTGVAGSPMITADPFIFKDAEGYHLFFSSLFCWNGSNYYFSWDPNNPAACDRTNTITATAYAFSTDQGLTWQIRSSPVFYPGAPGVWDSKGVETPNLVRVNNRLFLFYSGDAIGFENRFQIGVTAIDLAAGSVRTTFLVNNAVFPRPAGPLMPFNITTQAFTNNIQEPAVVFNNGRFEVYFTGLQLQLPGQPIAAAGQAVQYIGVGRRVFDSQFNVVEQNDVPLLDGVNMPEVRLVTNVYFMFSTIVEPGEIYQNEKLEYRTSLDGLTWSNAIPLLGPGLPGSIDNWGMAAPTVQPETNSFVIFYMALSEENHPCSLQPGGRFGAPVENSQNCVYTGIGRAVAGFSQ